MSKPKVNDIIIGTVVRVYPKYAILLFDEGYTGLLHISELSSTFVRNFTAYVKTGNIYKVKVIESSPDDDTMKVSVRALSAAEKKSPLERVPVNPSDISFSALEEHIPAWVKEENEGGESS